ncbi:MAG: hypothetical protein IPP66_13675 [Anaerolineales bacterium]|nr:hypothetical protein [Anaerolineales bacterium]
MSMDEQYAQMQNFQRALIGFNENLSASLSELQAQHDNVSPHWQDEMRKHYDSVWGPFQETMKHYVASEGPGFVEFLTIKLHALGRYLQGG